MGSTNRHLPLPVPRFSGFAGPGRDPIPWFFPFSWFVPKYTHNTCHGTKESPHNRHVLVPRRPDADPSIRGPKLRSPIDADTFDAQASIVASLEQHLATAFRRRKKRLDKFLSTDFTTPEKTDLGGSVLTPASSSHQQQTPANNVNHNVFRQHTFYRGFNTHQLLERDHRVDVNTLGQSEKGSMGCLHDSWKGWEGGRRRGRREGGEREGGRGGRGEGLHESWRDSMGLF